MPNKKKEPAAAATATDSKKIISIDKYTPKDSVCQALIRKYLDELADECERVLKLEREISEVFGDGSFQLCCSSWNTSYDNTTMEMPQVHLYKGIEAACASVDAELHDRDMGDDTEYFFIYRGIRFFQLGRTPDKEISHV